MNNQSQNISVLEMFKIGIGPSSSHTMGPWKAALRFLGTLEKSQSIEKVDRVFIDLYGSLALTGKGHGTDKALILGLSGGDPESISQNQIAEIIDFASQHHELTLNGKQKIGFIQEDCIRFYFQEKLDFHPNGMRISAYDQNNHCVLEKTYFSIGGGFIIEENEEIVFEGGSFPYPIDYANDLRNYCKDKELSIASVVYQNELSLRNKEQLDNEMLKLWEVMSDAIFKGCHTEGVLPGALKVTRRAAAIHKRLMESVQYGNDKNRWLEELKKFQPGFDKVIKFVSCFAIATNEENANFGRVVTAPTNGAAGVIPAVLMYFICLSEKKEVSDQEIIDFLCVAGEIGSLFKKGATISAALGGCQAEIGVSSAMAAAALTSGLGGTVDQSLMAAEIAMEHHLGLTCDPIQGLVQIPCIERNTMGAIKAITAAQIALESNPELAKVSLDDVINTMWRTACDMDVRYKETSLGGLAANIAVSVPEC